MKKTDSYIGRLLPRARRPHFVAFAALAAAVMVCAGSVAMWAAAVGRDALWAVATTIAAAAAAAAYDCDRAAGGIFSR